jgi:hypothetical protein
MPMDSENGDNFIQVNRKKKKAKIDQAPTLTPSPCTSTSSSSSSSIDTDKSTSSTNTSSIITTAHSVNITHKNNGHTQTNPGKNPVTDTSYIANGISQQARRYAETRYAFPPFVVKLNQAVDEKAIIQFISTHFSSKFDFNLKFAGHRLKDKRELLLFVNDRQSFEMLFDHQKWPTTINSLDYEKVAPKHLPPQFSIIFRNVPVDIEIDSLLAYTKNEYPDVISMHRILSANKQPTSFVRVDISSVAAIDELLGKKFFYYNSIRLAITEYLAPAKVLVCTKCYQIGHFRSTCKSTLEICRTCGDGVTDIKEHKEKCNKKQCCVRCKGSHESNDVRCPEIKSYRTTLTKSLLSSSGTNTHQQHHQNVPVNYRYNEQDFPVLNVNNKNIPHRNYSINNYNNNTGQRIDELLIKMNKLDDNLNQLINYNNKYLDQVTRLQLMTYKHEHQLQLHHTDLSFQHDFVSQFISPICQIMVDVIPVLVKQNTINDKTLLCPSLTALCEKLSLELPIWTNRFVQMENYKIKLINDFNLNNQLTSNCSTNIFNTNNNVEHHPPIQTSNQ